MIPSPSGQGQAEELLLVEVSAFSDDVRSKLRTDVNKIAQEHNEEKNVHSTAVVYVECPAGRRQKELEGARQDGCISELFTLSMRARKRGWTRLLVADSLTRRQLDRDLNHSLRRWERASEATVVSIHLASSIEETPLAKRLPLSIAVKAVCDADDGAKSEGNEYSEMEPYESGFLLHDPDGRLFTPPNRASELQWEKVEHELSASLGLPSEISALISNYVFEEQPVEAMTSVPRVEESSAIVPIPALNPATNSTIKSAQDSMTKILHHHSGEDDKACKIYPWKLTSPATRRNVYRLYERILNGESKGVIGENGSEYLLWDIDLWSEDSRHEVIFMSYDARVIAKAINIDEPLLLKAMADQEERMRHQIPRLYEEEDQLRDDMEALRNKMNEKARAKEFLPDFDQRFFYDPPDWAPGGDESIPVVYFLTKHLSDDDVNKIKHELIYERNEADDSYDEGAKQYHFVPWKQEADGTAEDMARIHKLCSKYHYKWFCLGGQQIFVDRRSAQDLTALLVDTWHSKNSMRYLGIQYGRLAGRDAHIAWVNLDIANMDITELVDEGDDINLFKDPDNPESDSEGPSDEEIEQDTDSEAEAPLSNEDDASDEDGDNEGHR